MSQRLLPGLPHEPVSGFCDRTRYPTPRAMAASSRARSGPTTAAARGACGEVSGAAARSAPSPSAAVAPSPSATATAAPRISSVPLLRRRLEDPLARRQALDDLDPTVARVAELHVARRGRAVRPDDVDDATLAVGSDCAFGQRDHVRRLADPDP